MTIIYPHERLGLVAENIAGAEVVDSNSYGYSVRIILLMGQEIDHDKFAGSHYGHVLDLVPTLRSGEPSAEQWARVTREHHVEQELRRQRAYIAALAERDRILAMIEGVKQ